MERVFSVTLWAGSVILCGIAIPQSYSKVPQSSTEKEKFKIQLDEAAHHNAS